MEEMACTCTAAAAKSHQSCPTLCDPIDGSPPGLPIPEILQARTLEWVAISFSSAWKWKLKVKPVSRVTPWTAAYQAPPSWDFSRQEYWSGSPVPSPMYMHRWEDLLAVIIGNDVYGTSSLSWPCLETVVNTVFFFLYQWFSLTWPEMFFSFSLVLQSASVNPFLIMCLPTHTP